MHRSSRANHWVGIRPSFKALTSLRKIPALRLGCCPARLSFAYSRKNMYPPAYPHDTIQRLYPGVFLLQGSIRMGPGMRMNRNMVILQSNSDVSLINPVRMNEEGLASLDALGKVKNIIRLGDFHGLGDAFYLERYRCDFWAQKGQETYKLPVPSKEISSSTAGPVENSEFFLFESANYPEAALLINEHKLLITTDSIQYYSDWRYFSWFTQCAFKLLGFKKGLNIGGPWLKRATPKGVTLEQDFENLLKLDFDALIAAHGSLIRSGAKNQLRDEIRTTFK
jgi:hypothetical protein